MNLLIQFHKPKCLIHLLLITIIRFIKTYIKDILPEYLRNSIINRIFLFSISNLLVGIFYFIEKYHINKRLIRETYFSGKKELSILNGSLDKKIIFYIFICWISTTLSELKYKYYFYNPNMDYIESSIEEFELFSLFLSCLLIEKYFLKCKTYRHHKLSLLIIIIISLITTTIDIPKGKQYKIYEYFFVIIILSLSQYHRAVSYSISKKLNYNYYINMNLILFIIGLFGVIIITIFNIFYVYAFKYNKSFFTIDKNKKKNNFSSLKIFFLLNIYVIINCFLHISYYKIIEETKPSYMLISKGFSQMLIPFFKMFTIHKINLKIKESIYSFLFLIALCIFSEVITLNFWNLDKNTKIKIISRSNDTIFEYIKNKKEETP